MNNKLLWKMKYELNIKWDWMYSIGKNRICYMILVFHDVVTGNIFWGEIVSWEMWNEIIKCSIIYRMHQVMWFILELKYVLLCNWWYEYQL